MKCTNCGAEVPENEKICSECGTEVETVTETAAETVTETAAETAETAVETTEAAAETAAEEITETPAPKKSGKKIVAAAAAVAVLGAGAFAATQVFAKNPQDVVIEAIDGVFAEGQTNPMEELFGVSQFADGAQTTDSEIMFRLKLDDSSIAEAAPYKGSGLRIAVKNDVTNMKSAADMGLIYNDMDLVTLNSYYGDDTLMMAMPELTKKVFTVDLGEGLADRLAQSLVIGPMLEESGMDAAEFGQYIQDALDRAKEIQKDPTAAQQIDVKALMNRYKEGTQAEKNFKAAWTVTKGEKASFTVDGTEVNCKGYNVAVSKASMMEFLRTSSDFFLQDEQLKSEYLKQLEMTAQMSKMAGGAVGNVPTAEELLTQSYDELTKSVNELLDELDKALNDITMVVYVDNKGNLAAVDGTTMLNGDTEDKAMEFAFHVEVKGGVYRTQNVDATITLTNKGAEAEENDIVTIGMIKQGTYDGKSLTADLSLTISNAADGSDGSFLYTGTYYADGGDYHVLVEADADGEQLAAVSATGAVDQLEKGKSIHINLDELKVSYDNEAQYVTLGGEYSYQPLASEVTVLTGDEMDVLAATNEDWQNVLMEIIMSAYGMMMQLGGAGN